MTKPRSSSRATSTTISTKLADCDWIIEAIVENLDAKRALWHESGSRSQARCDSLHQHQRHSARQNLGRLLARFPPPLPRHALLQSAALSAFDGADSRPGNRSRHSRRRRTVRRPPSRQGRGAYQGHAQLHRQPHRQLPGRDHRQNHARGRFHHRRSGRAHRLAHRRAQQRQLPPARFGRAWTSGPSSEQICTSLFPTIPGASAFCRSISKRR